MPFDCSETLHLPIISSILSQTLIKNKIVLYEVLIVSSSRFSYFSSPGPIDRLIKGYRPVRVAAHEQKKSRLPY